MDKRPTIEMNGESCFLNVSHYINNPMVMSVQLITDSGEPYCAPTVNLGNSIGNDSYMQPFAAFMDINNCSDVIRKFEDIGLIEPYVRAGEHVTMTQGFVDYPLYSFSRSMLEHFDKDGTDAYIQKYSRQLAAEQAVDIWDDDFSDDEYDDFGDLC